MHTFSLLSMEEEKHESAPVVHQNGEPKISDPKQLGVVEYQCNSCTRWFPQRIAQNIQQGPVRPPSLPYSLNYDYMCNVCSPSKKHTFAERENVSFREFCATALANLTLRGAGGTGGTGGGASLFFSRDSCIVPFIEEHWSHFTALPLREKTSARDLIAKALLALPHVFAMENDEKSEKSEKNDAKFSLKIVDFHQLNPHDFALLTSQPTSQLSVPPETKDVAGGGGKVQRPGAKKKVGGGNFFGFFGISKIPPLISFPEGVPVEVPSNKESYRYLLAECDKNSPLGASYIENPGEWHGPQARPIPGHMYRVFVPKRVRLSLQERAPQLKVASDGRTVTGDKGYSMVRGTHSVSYGRWFFEFVVLELPGNSAVRAGWGTVFSVLQAPLGFDKFGYSFRSRKGTVFHHSKGKHYADGYGAGDVVGCLIELPLPDTLTDVLPNSMKSEPLVKYKGYLYYEVKDDIAEQLRSLKVLKNSKITFFKNGVSQGVAFSDVYAGEYFPSISLYKDARVKVNYGPKFDCPPKNVSYLPITERVREASVDQTMSDVLYSLTSTADFLRPLSL